MKPKFSKMENQIIENMADGVLSKNSEKAIKMGREFIANLAKKDGEAFFAHEVLVGCWDHRNDVSKAINQAQKFGKINPNDFKRQP